MQQNLSDQFKLADGLLEKADKIMIASHENPDPDAVASVLALHYFFKKKNLKSFPYLPDDPPGYLSFMPGFCEIKTVPPSSPDLLFGLDYGDFKRLRIPERISKDRSLRIITIDHHLQGDQRGDVKILAPEFSSTAEIIYQWLLYNNFEIDREIAACILVGIFADSGGLKHVSTNSTTFRAVSELMSKGVCLDKIIRSALTFHLAGRYDGVGRVWGSLLKRIKVDKKTGLAYSWIRFLELKKFKIKPGDFDGLTNMITAGSPINLGLLLIEHRPGEIKGSLRSEPLGGVDVAKIAKAMSGGGHFYAAGFQQKGKIEEILKKVLNLIE